MTIGEISENVLNLLEKSSRLNSLKLDEEDVEGKVHEINADSDADMLVCSCYIAECLLFQGRKIDIAEKGIPHLRSRILDTVM